MLTYLMNVAFNISVPSLIQESRQNILKIELNHFKGESMHENRHFVREWSSRSSSSENPFSSNRNCIFFTKKERIVNRQ